MKRKLVYPALLPTIKTNDKPPFSMVSRELRSKIRQLVSTSLFPYNTVRSVVSSIIICDIVVKCNSLDCWWQ